MTAKEIINSSLRLIGVIASGETATGGEFNDSLTAFKALLSQWSSEGLLSNAMTREVFGFTVPNKKYYTLGTGGDFNSARPTRILRIGIQDGSMVNVSPDPMNPDFQEQPSSYEIPVRIINLDEYASISNKDSASKIPSSALIEMESPLAKIFFWPVPNDGQNAVIYSEKSFADITDVDADMGLPPGYDYALKYNLAIELAPEFGVQTRAEIAQNAKMSKGSIKIANTKNVKIKTDAFLATNRTFDITIGGYR